MRFALAGVCLLLSAACGAAPEPPDVAPPTVELPAAGLLGALPPRERRVDVVVDGEGTFTINGEACAWANLQARLIEVSGGPRSALVDDAEDDTEEVDEQEIVIEEPVVKDIEELEEFEETEEVDDSTREPGVAAVAGPQPRLKDALEPDGSRAADVLLRIDRRVPWVVVVRLLQSMAEPHVKLYRTWWAVTGEDGQGEGGVAVFLPKDRCGPVGKEAVFPEILRARLRADGDSDDMRDLYSVARALRAGSEAPVLVSLDAPALTPWGQVVELADMALRAEVAGFTTHGIWPIDEAKTVREWMDEAAAGPPLRLTLRTDLEVDTRAARLPPRRRIDGELVGFGNAASFAIVEEVIEEVEEGEDVEPGPFDESGPFEQPIEIGK